MTQTFPPRSAPPPTDDNIDNPKATDCGLARTSTYACFSWSEAEAALKQTLKLAEKHRVRLFDVSSDEGDVWIRGRGGKLEKVGGG